MAVTPSLTRWSITAGSDEAGEGTAQRLRDIGMARGHALHMRLVDHSFMPRTVGAVLAEARSPSATTTHFGMKGALSILLMARSVALGADLIAEQGSRPK